MIHPHLLHVQAAAWSLQAARTALEARRAAEQRAIITELLEPPSLLRSSTWGRRQALGGHGDPTTTAILDAERPPRVNRYAVLAADITERLAAPARHLPGAGDPLDRIRDNLPAMSLQAAAATARLLVRLDERVRRDLGIDDDRQLLVGQPCPRCGVRQLYARTSGPESARVVECRAAAGCLCQGDDCPCGMPVRAAGVAHIWPRAAVIAGAVAGNAPTTTN